MNVQKVSTVVYLFFSVSYTALRGNLLSLTFVNVLATGVPIHVFAIFVISVFNGNGGVRDVVLFLQHLLGFLED